MTIAMIFFGVVRYGKRGLDCRFAMSSLFDAGRVRMPIERGLPSCHGRSLARLGVHSTIALVKGNFLMVRATWQPGLTGCQTTVSIATGLVPRQTRTAPNAA
jgi:hypothetical protein